MTSVLRQTIETPEAAFGRFFDVELLGDGDPFYDYSQEFFRQNEDLLNNAAAIVLQAAISREGVLYDIADSAKPADSAVVTINFDASQSALERFAWQLIYTQPGRGQEVSEIKAAPFGSTKSEFYFDQQGQATRTPPLFLEPFPHPFAHLDIEQLTSSSFFSEKTEQIRKRKEHAGKVGFLAMQFRKPHFR